MNCYECDGAKAIVVWELSDYEDGESYMEDFTILKYKNCDSPFSFWLDSREYLGNERISFQTSEVVTLCPYCDGTGVEDGH